MQPWTVEHICWFALEYLNIVIQPHQKVWLKHLLEGGKRVLLLAPRGHGKTTTLIKVLLVYAICYDPDIKILLASHKEAVAKRQARLIQLALERKKIQQDFNISKGAPWRRDEFYIKEGGIDKDEPVVFCVAGQGGMTGYRFNWIIFDDLLVKDNQRTDVSRRRLKEWIEDEVLKARDPGENQKIIVIGTRKHYKDWYRELLESGQFICRVDKAELEDGSCLWPARLDEHGKVVESMFDHEELMSRKVTEGARSYAQEYMNDPSPEEGMYLQRDWLKFYDMLPPRHCLRVFMGVDPSGGSTSENASSLGIAVVAADTRPDFPYIYVLELLKGKYTLGAQFDKIQELYAKWKPESVNVEAVMYNRNFAERVITRIPDAYPIDYIHSKLSGTSEVSKELRIKNFIGLMFEEGRILLRDPAYDYTVREFIEAEYIVFPEKDGETDLLDALTLAVDFVQFDVDPDDPVFLTW